MPDERALEILFHAHWSPQGWTNRPVPPGDFAYAKAAGMMFDPVLRTHTQTISQVQQLVQAIDVADVSLQFVASLSTRRLDLRSALGSYAVGRVLPVHQHSLQARCEWCGSYLGSVAGPVDLNVLNFERFKWGGVRHTDPEYIAFDLEQFARAEWVRPTSADFDLMNAILTVIRSLEPKARPNDLVKSLAGVFPSNVNERRTLVQILGYCSIISTPSTPGFYPSFVKDVDRPFPPGSKNDWAYPVAHWTGAAGVNMDALRFFFPFAQIAP